MRSSLDLDYLSVRSDLSALIVRSERNIRRSRALRFHRDCFKTWQTYDRERG